MGIPLQKTGFSLIEKGHFHKSDVGNIQFPEPRCKQRDFPARNQRHREFPAPGCRQREYPGGDKKTSKKL